MLFHHYPLFLRGPPQWPLIWGREVACSMPKKARTTEGIKWCYLDLDTQTGTKRTLMPSHPITLAWQDLELALRDIVPDVFKNLEPGAKESDYSAVEHLIGFRLPEDFREFYNRHNGHITIEDIDYEFHGTDYFLFACHFFPLYLPDREIDDLEDLELWDCSVFDIIDRGMDHMTQLLDEMEIDEAIKPLSWNIKWIPIACTPEEDYICVDYDPSDEGTTGQVIFCRYSQSQIQVIAPSLAEFLLLQAEDLKNGNTVADPKT